MAELIRELIAALVALTALIGSLLSPPAVIAVPNPEPPPAVYATPCQEDEAWVTVDYRDPVAIEDAAGVSRRCIPLDDLGL